ncbi:MAG: hypothetical protein V3S81_09595 [Anaerolineales bacterium]
MSVPRAVGVLKSGDDYHNPAANTVATKTLAAPGAGRSWVIGGILFGYDVVAGTQDVLLESPAGTKVLEFPHTIAGPQDIDFIPPKKFPEASAVKLSLPAGGTGITGFVAFKTAWIE